jgi:superfamily I DNA and RNA helicase
MVVILGKYKWDFDHIAKMIGQALNRAQISFYIPKANQANSFDTEGDASQFWLPGAVTLAQVTRAKGNEAEVVYVVGLDSIALREASPEARNELFVALTRSRGFAHLSGIGSHAFYREVQEVLNSGPTFRFTYRKPKRELSELA